ncbi:TetR family transcriptional regulator [Corynebacterium pacaense]|uniref:TetR family transcriptional regulator n=1 Tax=Corynebacterium pacaense TaxID=1816684 RepID=UPI001FE3AC42|nr:TetR family transcriptional regulator [Corynebacterium pacaense]
MQLNRDAIITSALDILDTYGIADMTMRRVAKQLEVAPGALYWHFRNKQELIDATARRILQPLFGESVIRSAPETCRHLRTLMIEHRDGAELVSAALSDEALHAQLQDAVAASISGADGERREIGAFTLLHFVIGAVLAEQTRTRLDEVSETAAPEVRAAFEDRFDNGVNIIISGLNTTGTLE